MLKSGVDMYRDDNSVSTKPISCPLAKVIESSLQLFSLTVNVGSPFHNVFTKAHVCSARHSSSGTAIPYKSSFQLLHLHSDIFCLSRSKVHYIPVAK